MRRGWIEHLVCPRTGARYDLDPVRVVDDEVIEGFLVSRDERDVRPVVAGVAVLPADLGAHMREQGNVYRRSPINDPRLARFLLAQVGTGFDTVPFDEVVGHYRDLARDPPDGYDTTPHPEDVALASLLGEVLGEVPREGRGLVVGCGVGRSVFVLAERCAHTLGLDRSVACVRRARNVAVTNEAFFLPAPKGSGLKEIPLDLSGLTRAGTDFAVGDAEALPFVDARFDVVVVQAADARGTWTRPTVVLTEAARVLAPGGVLVLHEALGAALLVDAVGEREPYRASRRP